VRILQLSKFFPPVRGGIETIALELTEGFNALGIPTDVLCANLGLRTRIEKRQDYTVERAGSLGKLLSTSMSPALAWRVLRHRSRYDILHVHLPNPMANLALWIARWPHHVVVHWHSDIVNQPRALQLYAPLQDWLLRRADAIIATSAAYAEHSPWLVPYRDKVRIVPLGFDPARCAQDEREQAAAAIRERYLHRPIVFALGRMAAYKGFDSLIDVVRLLRADAQVVVCGDGELLKLHREQVRAAGLADRIAFVGDLPAADVEAHLAAASVFCLPSRSRAEAFGMVLLEAMAAGRPIVASDIAGSGVSWVNADGETGYNVPVGDDAAMAAAIDRLLADPALARRMGEAGRRRLQGMFSTQQMIAGTLAVYREACGVTF
jgi:glycosyltransferase involved in cell wall biosynthesis